MNGKYEFLHEEVAQVASNFGIKRTHWGELSPLLLGWPKTQLANENILCTEAQ
jgi:hypothetical protein